MTLVYPCSGLNIDSNDVTDSPELKHGSARGFIKFVLVKGRRQTFWIRKNFLLKFIVLGCYAPSIFIILLPILSYIYRDSLSVNFVQLFRIYICFSRLSGLCRFRLELFILVIFSLVERCSLLRLPFRFE